MRSRGVFGATVDLAVPVECGGCRRHGIPWCRRCDRTVHDDPVALRPRVDPGVPAWAAGRYSGPLRNAVVDLKEHRRTDLVPVLGDLLAVALLRLADWGDLPAARTLALVPAPTRAGAARRRGGDPVTAIAVRAAERLGPRVAAVPLLRTAGWARDSAGLGAGRRLANLRDAVTVGEVPAAVTGGDTAVVLVDDVLTTGATAAVSVSALRRAGAAPVAVLVCAGA
ncbi:MAG: ComF family protein [Gordonia sp. (in: high G+C Gram-positive bacteria)]|uniref:ComF family protein n=1 Tax=Gordonia sp. (in: high G+C Gram-positive bacteria) TaxID=84139 RepID=UPI0039E36C23